MTRIPLEVLFHRAIDILEQERIRHLVVGGLAMPLWGETRPTEDVDFVVLLDPPDAQRLLCALRNAGFFLPENAETLMFVDGWTKASRGGRDVDLALGATEFDLEALKRAVRVPIFGRPAAVVTAEDLILYKLAAYRHKDLGDVDEIMMRQRTKLDVAYLRQWARRIAEATGKFEVPQTLEKMLAEQSL